MTRPDAWRLSATDPNAVANRDALVEQVAGALCEIRDEREHYPFAEQPCDYCVALAEKLTAAMPGLALAQAGAAR